MRTVKFETDASGNTLLGISKCEWIHSLSSDPKQMEDSLRQGKWLILCLAVWSMPDLQSLTKMLSVKQHENKNVSLATRPFASLKEFRNWCDVDIVYNKTPIWIRLSNGKVVEVLYGAISDEEYISLSEA